MIKHTVLFRLTCDEPQLSHVIENFKNSIEALPAQIDVIRHIEVSRNINENEQYHIALHSHFDTLADVDTYAKHPAHLAAAGILKGHVASRACVDYEV